jgi:hypothetical protein
MLWGCGARKWIEASEESSQEGVGVKRNNSSYLLVLNYCTCLTPQV